jgi:Tfp pilus assembly protein PilX
MLFKKKEGIVLVVVLIVMAVLTILGTGILQVSLGEAKQASYEEKRIQAQYLARSGAEAAIGAWSKAISDGATLPSGPANTVYLDNTNQFVTTPPTSYIGRFTATITGTNPVIVSSVGTVDGINQTITATIIISSHTTQVTNEGTEMSTQNWYAANGKVSNSTPPAHNELNAIINPPSGNGILKFVQTDSIFEAASIDFKVAIWNFKNALVLKSDKIIFEKLIDFRHGGSLILRVNPGQTRPGKGAQLFGKVQYNGVWYWFSDNMTLTDPLTQLLDPIPVGSADIPTSTNTATVNDYTIKWN